MAYNAIGGIMPDKEEKPKRKQNQPPHHAAKSKQAVKLRRKRIIKAIAQDGKTLKQAGIEAGLSPKTAAQQVCGILNEPDVKATFKALLDAAVPDSDLSTKYKELLSSKKVISAMVMASDGMKDAGSMTKDFIEVDDCATQLRTADSVSKLKGHLVDRHAQTGKDDGPVVIRVVYSDKKPNGEG